MRVYEIISHDHNEEGLGEGGIPDGGEAKKKNTLKREEADY